MATGRALTSLGGRGDDGRNVKDLAQSSVGQDVLLVQSRVKVACQLVQTDLDVENDQDGVILVETLKGERCFGHVSYSVSARRTAHGSDVGKSYSQR